MTPHRTGDDLQANNRPRLEVYGRRREILTQRSRDGRSATNVAELAGVVDRAKFPA
jgi:hypothetical protein